MKYYITFNYQNNGRADKIAAMIDGTHVSRWWGKHKLPDVTLTKEYPFPMIQRLHPMDIQQGVFMVAGFEAGNISDLRIFQDERDWSEIYDEVRG